MARMTRRSFAQLAGSAAAGVIASNGKALAAPADLTALTLAEASRRIRDRTLTATQLTEACLSRIGVYGPKLNAFITVMRGRALAGARQLDAEQKAGRLRGPLHGIPIALKDLVDTAGVRTTAGSGVFKDRIPTRDAAVVERLRAAGAVIIAKTNLQEFAFGAGETSYYGPARNPWALDRGTGGSSSGSGAAVAADLCFGAIGTDTAASIRQPASLNGIVGLKPTFGLVSCRGVVPLTASLDCTGPMARTVDDVALMLGPLAGYDPEDPVSVSAPPTDYVAALRQPVAGFRLGLPAGYFDDLEPEVGEAVSRAVKLLASMTKGTREVRLPSTAAYSINTLAPETYAVHEPYLKSDPEGYAPHIRKRLEALADVKAADYVRSRQAMELLRRSIDGEASRDVDLLVAPTEQGTAPLLNEMIARAVGGQTGLPPLLGSGTRNLSPINAYGLPAISVPCGFSKAGLPIGLMIVGPHFAEGRILALAAAYQKVTDWTARKPPLTPDMPVPTVTGYPFAAVPGVLD